MSYMVKIVREKYFDQNLLVDKNDYFIKYGSTAFRQMA